MNCRVIVVCMVMFGIVLVCVFMLLGIFSVSIGVVFWLSVVMCVVVVVFGV